MGTHPLIFCLLIAMLQCLMPLNHVNKMLQSLAGLFIDYKGPIPKGEVFIINQVPTMLQPL